MLSFFQAWFHSIPFVDLRFNFFFLYSYSVYFQSTHCYFAYISILSDTDAGVG